MFSDTRDARIFDSSGVLFKTSENCNYGMRLPHTLLKAETGHSCISMEKEQANVNSKKNVVVSVANAPLTNIGPQTSGWGPLQYNYCRQASKYKWKQHYIAKVNCPFMLFPGRNNSSLWVWLWQRRPVHLCTRCDMINETTKNTSFAAQLELITLSFFYINQTRKESGRIH